MNFNVMGLKDNKTKKAVAKIKRQPLLLNFSIVINVHPDHPGNRAGESHHQDR